MLRALKTPVAFCLVNSSKILIYSLLACLFILFSSQTRAQSLRSAYPVQVTAFLPPPHSLYLGDYCSSTKEKLVVNLLNRDLQEPELEVKLHLSIRSSGGITLETKDYRVYPSIGLHAGTPCQLTRDDLCPYFQQENLDIQGTLPGGKLPEGLLEICITVLETHTGRVVSSASCARAWINLNRPPLLNLPANSAAFPFCEPLNILFQWTPRHQALSNVEYEFVLKEIVDEAIAPQAAFPYSREIYTTTLRSTNLAYTPLQPPLQENRQYAWQVRAAVRDGFEELNVFENQGYSEIHTFSIRPGCFPPTGVSHRQHLQHLVVEWTPPANAGQSVVAYRSKAAGGDWHSVQGNAGYANLTDLTHSIEYEYKAGTLCVDGSIRYGEVHTALLENTREDLEASCGILPRNDNSNTAPLKFMNPGDVFLAGDFPVSVTRVSGENGYFSGNGWIRIPFMNDAKVAVEFKAIGINADSRLTSGVVETSYDQFEANIANMDDLWHGGSTTPTPPGTVTTDAKAGFEIPEEGGVKLSEDGTILLIIDPDGNPVGTIPVPDQYAEAVQKGLPVTITIEDAKGTTCEVKTGGKETGSISPTGKKGDPLAPGSFDETKLAGGKAVVEFLPAPESRYAFDTWKDYYRKVSLIVSRGGYEFIGSYAVPFKLIPPGKSDPVAVRVRVVDKKLNPDSILYKTSTGYEVKPEEGILTLSAGKENSYQDLYALYPDGQGGYLTLGKLKILSYSEPTFPVVLIPVNGNRVDESQIETYLNSREVYGSLGIRWEVSQDTTFTCPDENLHSDGSDLFSRYTDEMKRLNSAYRASRGQLDNKTVYLFVLRSGSVDGLYAGGDMPRSGQFGYLFTEGSHDLNRTIAHELAHGKFRLRHTFDSEYGQVEELARGGTKNLMDYGTGTELAKWQWDEIFNPALLVSPFESDEEAMSPWTTSAQEDITRFMELYGCALRQSKTFDFPKPAYWPNNGTLNASVSISGKDYSVMMAFTKDLINYKTKKLTCELKNGTGYYYLDDCYLAVNGGDLTTFTSYINGEIAGNASGQVLGKQIDEKKWDEVYKTIYQTSSCFLGNLSVDKKLQVLQQIAQESYIDDYKDHVVINILESICQDKAQSKSLIEWMDGHPKEILSLYRGVDDETTGDQFCGYILLAFQQHNDRASLQETLEQNKYFILDNSKKTYIEAKYGNLNPSSITFNQVLVHVKQTNQLRDINPMTPLGLWMTDGKSELTDDILYYLPAIYVVYLVEKKNSEDLKAFLAGSLQIVSVAGGYGLLIKGGSAILKVAGALEMANATTNLTLQSDFIRNKLHKTEDGKKFLELWPTISIVTDIATLTTFVVVANKSAMLLDEVSSIERQTVNKQIERAESLVAGKGKLNLGKFVKKIGDYEVYEGGEVFYRAMKKEHYESLLTTKKLTASSETFTSPTAIYSENYEGYLVKFSVKQGTIDKLKAIGVSDESADVIKKFGEMPKDSKGWIESFAKFKKEGNQVNIGLGKGKALGIFNDNINEFELLKIIKK